MAVHIGEVIREKVKNKGLKADYVAKFISSSESNLFNIYRRKSIDIDKLIRFSQLLDENLFLYYLNEEPIKSMFDKQVGLLQERVLNLENELKTKDEKLEDLNRIIGAQNKVIALHENQTAADKKRGKK